jgi:hypothetical protein
MEPNRQPGTPLSVEVVLPIPTQHETVDGWMKQCTPALFSPWASAVPTFLPNQINDWRAFPSVEWGNINSQAAPGNPHIAWGNCSPAEYVLYPTLELQPGN